MEGMLETRTLRAPISAHLRTDHVALPEDLTVQQALDRLLEQQPQGRILYFYVVDDAGRLRGVLPTRRLLLSPRERKLSEIMVAPVIAIPHHATVLEACEFFVLHKLLAFPVVDDDRKLLGLVDVDLYTSEMHELETSSGSSDLFQLIGVYLQPKSTDSPWTSFRQRFPWLLANIGGGLLAAVLTGFFEAELERVVALALFIPVVLALAESVSIQSVSLALEAMRGQPPTWRRLLRKLLREASTGVLLGAACGLSVAVVALAWIGLPRLAVCILGGIAGGVTSAAAIGLAIPNLLRLWSRDPQVAAGPVALALADMATLLLYFGLARLLL